MMQSERVSSLHQSDASFKKLKVKTFAFEHLKVWRKLAVVLPQQTTGIGKKMGTPRVPILDATDDYFVDIVER